MAFLKVLSCSLIFISSVASSVDEFPPDIKFRPETNLITNHYNIKFALYPDNNIFYGEYNVSCYIPYETQNIYVYTENLSIIGVKIINNAEISKKNKETFIHRSTKIIHDTKTYVTTISFPFYLSGVYTLNMKYTGLLGDNGGFRIFYINNNYGDQQNNTVWLAATHYDRFPTRRLFPLLKNTTYASYNISIKHHRSYTALSNMPKLAVNNMKTDENNMTWTHFKTTPMMYDYLLVAAVTDLSYITKTNQNIRLWCTKNMLSSLEFAYSVAKSITLILDRQWPSTRKTPEINHIVIPKLLNEKEIMLGIVLHREADIIYNEETDHEGRKIEIIRLIGFKVAHEWFYNAILPYMWEDNPWLREGFAMFFGIYVANMNYPHFRIQDFLVVQMQHELLHWSTKDIWPLNLKVNSFIEIPHYIKGSIMYRTLQTIITKDVFWNGINIYLYNQTNNDFWIAMQTSMKNSSLFKIKYDIQTKMANWGQLEHYPVLNVKRNYNVSTIYISVENINTKIWIPVSITTQTRSNLNEILHTLWLDTLQFPNDTLYITFEDENDWILVNLQQIGCYRVNYDAENWNRLSKYLNSRFFEDMHVLDRAKIIDDTFHFLMTGQLNLNTFLSISHYLGQDTDYIAWYPMFKNLEYMSGFFAFPESAFIKREISTQLNILLSKIKYPDFTLNNIFQGSVHTKCLREEAAKWSCILSDDSCFSLANYKLKSIWPEWLFCNGLVTASEDTWMKVFNIYMNKSDNNILKWLACSKNFSIILQYMDLMTLGATLGKIITDFDHINSFYSIVARHANNIQILDFMLYNLEKIKPRQMNVIPALTVIINHVYSKQRINEIKEFVNNKIHVSKCPTFFLFTYNYDRTDFNKYCPFKYYNETQKENIIKYLNRKLEVRWHQIKTQIYQYRHLIKDFNDIFSEYLAD